MPIRKVIHETNSAPIKIWTNDIDENTVDQLKKMAKLPFIYKHIAVMPDAHLGKGACVGSVIATKGAIIPAAVGVDIGCGMLACKIPVKGELFTDKNNSLIRSLIESQIPVGFHKNKELSRSLSVYGSNILGFLENDYYKLQLGTLGGGNHFIELCRDEVDDIWVVIHSGSRKFGNDSAEEYISKAKGLMKEFFINLDDPDLAYLPSQQSVFDDYINILNKAQRYAKANRLEMLIRVIGVLDSVFNDTFNVALCDIIDCHHNYTEKLIDEEDVYLTRKGAVSAKEGDLGIIPGSMGASTYIVKGKGNEDSFCSCAHGAGRKFSRTTARKQFTTQDLADQTKGVECRKDKGIIDEIPGAYKDIKTVMEDQSDLVEIIHTLKQFICVKG